MRRTRKPLAFGLCIALVLAFGIGGTIAWLTDKTDKVENTFTVGDVSIELKESPLNSDGTYGAPAAGTQNEYKLIPGHVYTKDPTIHVTAGSEEVWLFVKVENGIEGIEADGDTDTIAEQLAANGWTKLDGVDNVYWHAVVDARQAAQDVPVFGTFTIGNEADVSTYGDASVNVTAYAVQKDSFASAAAAWTGAGFN